MPRDGMTEQEELNGLLLSAQIPVVSIFSNRPLSRLYQTDRQTDLETKMENFGNQICGRVQLFIACLTQCICLGFDSSFLSLLLHVKLIGPMLLIGSFVFTGGILAGGVSVWMNVYAKWNLFASMFLLLSVKSIALCVLALDLVDLIFLCLIGCAGFCIGAEQSLIFDLLLNRIPNPAKKLLLQMCFAGFALGNLLSSLFFDQTANPNDQTKFITTNETIYHSIYRSFNLLQRFQIDLRLNSSYIMVTVSILQCFLGYLVYDLWKQDTADGRPQTSEDVKSDYSRRVEWICSGFSFFSTGLIAVFPFYVFSFSPTDLSAILFYAFLLGCLASRLLLLVFACKFPPMFWICSSLIICGVSICCFSFEELRFLTPTIHGMALALMLPSIVSLLSKHKGASIHSLVCASVISSFIYPIVVTQVVQAYGYELFTTINFFTLLIMVCLFVCLLNIQSITEKPQDENHAKIWIFFQGQGVKRAHSVRKFISAFRDSLRATGANRSYRRLRRFQLSPQPNSTLIENPLANTRPYRSVNSARKGNFLRFSRPLYNSIDVAEPSTSLSLSPMPTEEPSQVSHLEDD